MGFDAKGEFWPAADPERKVAGHLVVDEVDGATLDLIGSFHDISSFGSLDHGTIRILGLADGRNLTLDRCIRTNNILPGAGPLRERYFANLVLEGALFEEGEDLAFGSFELRLSHLEEWVSLSGITIEYEWGKSSPSSIEKATLVCVPLDRLETETSYGKVAVGFEYNFGMEQFGSRTVREHCVFRVDYETPESLRDIFGLSSRLKDIVTLGVGEPSSIESLALVHHDIRRPIKVHTRWRGKKSAGSGNIVHPSKMFFTLQDIGGVEGVANWIETAKKFRAAIGSLGNYLYLPDLDVETRFVNVVVGLESFDRALTNFTGSKLKTRITRLADSAGEPFARLVSDVEGFADEVVSIRTENVHHIEVHGGDGVGAGPERIYWVCEAMYLLMLINLLRAAGVGEEEIAKIEDHERFRLVGDRLRG